MTKPQPQDLLLELWQGVYRAGEPHLRFALEAELLRRQAIIFREQLREPFDGNVLAIPGAAEMIHHLVARNRPEPGFLFAVVKAGSLRVTPRGEEHVEQDVRRSVA